MLQFKANHSFTSYDEYLKLISYQDEESVQ